VQADPVEVFRFDPDMAMTIKDGQFGSELGQLLGGATLEHADILFPEAEERYSPPDSEVRQLFAITSGSCTVAANELAPFVLGARKAMVAEPHQRWTASTTEPVMALFMEGSFDVWAVAVTKEKAVVPYDETWPDSIDRIRQVLEPFVDDVTLRIDHVGSTAVPGLAAKPVIDIDIVAFARSEKCEIHFL
jgi:hypothetical protein